VFYLSERQERQVVESTTKRTAVMRERRSISLFKRIRKLFSKKIEKKTREDGA
jgi:hypothetical protein